ncbi:MAG: signal recognition particle protein [Rhodospirillales bacterium]|nr:signal recognition particle protein [Rhodospirillales bacterium]
MFDALTERLGAVFDKLRKRGALKEADVDAALREIRVALLEADVALPVVKDFIARVKERAVGQDVVRSVTPGQMVVKIVYDNLVEMLGEAPAEINLVGVPPVTVMVVGLQGSGKTTTCAKLASRLQTRDKKKVLMASVDVYRPAAQQQLATLGEQAQVPTITAVLGERPLAIVKRALDRARREGIDVLILDTAGRLHIDEAMMKEAAEVRAAVNPVETLLVADAMTGQDAVTIAKEFQAKVGITGIALTRVDGDARGGAALSMRAVTGCPIKLMGTGEKLDALEAFQAARIAGQILGQGDIVGLVEKAQATVDKDDAEKLAQRALKGQFSLNDMADQFRQLRKMGNVQGLIGMIPGINRFKSQIADANIDDGMLKRQEAIILSMTRQERRDPRVLNGSRRRRIAAGSGTTVQDVNRLLKQFQQMSTLMKQVGKLGKRAFAPGAIPPGFKPPLPPGR